MKRREFLKSVGAGAMAAGVASSPFASSLYEATASAQMDEQAVDPTRDNLRNPQVLRYTVRDGAIVGKNGGFYNNRPLYCPHVDAAVLGGDRPFLRFLGENHVYGTFSVALVYNGDAKWFEDYDDVTMEYRCGRITWHLKDSSMPGVAAVLDAVPLQARVGFAVKLRVEGARENDRVIWAFGGAFAQTKAMWAFDPTLLPQFEAWTDKLSTVLTRGVEIAKCRDNQIQVAGDRFQLTPPGGGKVVMGAASPSGTLTVADGSAYANPLAFAASKAKDLPMAAGSVPLHATQPEIVWAFETLENANDPVSQELVAPEQAFEEGLKYMEGIAGRVVVKTPDPHLDAAVNAISHAEDAVFYPPVFRHGCMAWNMAFLGWRTLYGGTVFGWHDRVLAQAQYYIAYQRKDSTHEDADPDPDLRLCLQSQKSRYYGKGWVAKDSYLYNMQSQFFDQLVHAWRWTGDPQLESVLRRALELHAERMKDCFDPDGDGLYESYINTWPTDSVWYNGGGSVEESAYAYTVHRTLAEMTLRAGGSTRAEHHSQVAAHIRQALLDKLWLKDQGHFGAYLEQGGHQRVHEDAWLYSLFLPIDAGLTSPHDSLQALYYSDWGLQNVRPEFGGRLVWTSNWVPSMWSVRELYYGDNYHLALAHFQAGLPDEGWEILKGTALTSAFAGVAPGSQGQPEGGTDFNDLFSMFCRAVVEGLFGFSPDHPNGVVHVRPGFPRSWPEASIRTPDFSLTYRQEGETDHYELHLERAAEVDFLAPVRAAAVRRVTIDGREVAWEATPGFYLPFVRVKAPRTQNARLEIELSQRLQPLGPVAVNGKLGDTAHLEIQRGVIEEVNDLHGALLEPQRSSQRIQGRLAKPGHHLVLAKVRDGELSYWQAFKLDVADPEGKAQALAQTLREPRPNAQWKCLDLSPHYNGDIRAIYKQKYLSPRPNTVSARIGVDGYSPWTFNYWKMEPPAIDLRNIPKLLDAEGRLLTPQHVPFTRFAAERNIAFTSLWDNWPRSVTIPVHQGGEAVWLLLAGTTNPMQTRIANAELRFTYADGVVEQMPLVPPENFWTLCPLGARDYDYERDAFALPKTPPLAVPLGENCRAILASWKLRPHVELANISLETLSQEVVIGVMGVSLMEPE
ncbi:MAG: DUF4450 domain-containing protein [Acidobacteriota bacterium]